MSCHGSLKDPRRLPNPDEPNDLDGTKVFGEERNGPRGTTASRRSVMESPSDRRLVCSCSRVGEDRPPRYLARDAFRMFRSRGGKGEERQRGLNVGKHWLQAARDERERRESK